MDPKHALSSSSSCICSEVGGLDKEGDRTSPSTAWDHCPGIGASCPWRNTKKTGTQEWMLFQWFVTISATMMLMMQGSMAAEDEGGHHEATKYVFLPSNFSTSRSTGERPGNNDTDVMDGTGGSSGAVLTWLTGERLAELKKVVVTETGPRVQAETNISARTGVITDAGVFSEVKATDGLWLKEKSLSTNSEAWLGPKKLQTDRGNQEEQASVLSVPTMGPDAEVFQKPALGKALRMLSKAAWSKSLSSSLSKVSSSLFPTTKTFLLSSPSSSANNRESQTAESESAVLANSNSSNSNIGPDFEESVSSLPAWDLPTVPESLLSTVGDHDITLPANVTSPFSTHKWNTTVPTHMRNTSRLMTTSSKTINTSFSPSTTSTFQPSTTTEAQTKSVTPNTLHQNTVHNDGLQMTTKTTMSPSMTTFSVTTAETIRQTVPIGSTITVPPNTTAATIMQQTSLKHTTAATTLPATFPTTTETTTATTTSTTIAPSTTMLPTSKRTTLPTKTAITTATTTKLPATTEVNLVQIIPSSTVTTEAPFITSISESPIPCNMTKKYWVKTVLLFELPENCQDTILKQNLSKGLSHALQRALNDSTANAKVEHDDCSPDNVTLGYYVTSGKTVYISSLVVEALNIYGFDKLLTDMRWYCPLVKAVLVPVETWLPTPSSHLQLKTVLRFVGPTDNIFSCRFVEVLEQRLANAFEEAQDKVLETYNRLTVEIQSVLQENSPSVSLVYVVRNQDIILNGTVSSILLNQLTAELVGYFLFYPPLVIAEPLEYHNLNTSVDTKNYWVKTVIQDVDRSSLEANYQNFASLMEQRLAELFLLASRQDSQGARSRRATTVGGYTVQGLPPQAEVAAQAFVQLLARELSSAPTIPQAKREESRPESAPVRAGDSSTLNTMPNTDARVRQAMKR